MAEAEGGVLLIDVDREWVTGAADLRAEAIETLATAVRRNPASPVVVITGRVAAVSATFELAPQLRECFAENWALSAYGAAELTELAVRYLAKRGHEVPADVRAALQAALAESVERTVPAVHRFAARLVATGVTRTLAAADLYALGPGQAAVDVGEGLAAVG
jgi:hypothetical protein